MKIEVVDEETGKPTPARVSLIDERGKAWVAEDALPVAADCAEPFPPKYGPSSRLPPDGKSVWNPYTDEVQFYVDGTARASLPPGRYRATAYKGLEYAPTTTTVTVPESGTVQARLALRRWINMPERGWIGSDDHLHISRTSPDDDERIAMWMQAEGLDVANLLQMGTPHGIGAAPQRDFGKASVFRRGESRLVSGQENPRTTNFGHSIILGASTYIDFLKSYLVYGDFFRAAAQEGALSGYAHFGTSGARNGLAVDAPRGEIDFLEVLQVQELETQVLYEMWNLGFALTPTAGTDYPCGGIASLPGQERFYTQIEGNPSYETWLAGLGAGRTFVTNGPMLAFTVDGHGPGASIELAAPGTVDVVAEVRFDPATDRIDALELVRGGEVIARATEMKEPGRIALVGSPMMERSAWLALRATGTKVRTGVGGEHLPAKGHTAQVRVVVRGTPSVAEQPAGIEEARRSLERVNELEVFVSKARIPEADRVGLLEAIRHAQEAYRAASKQ